MDFTQIERQRMSRGRDETPVCSPARVSDKDGLLWGTDGGNSSAVREFASLFSSYISEICPGEFHVSSANWFTCLSAFYFIFACL